MQLTDLGFSVFNRKDSVPIELEVPDSKSYFPDLGLEGDKLENLSVSKLTAGSIRVGEYIQSTGFVAGTTGWQIKGDGTAQFKDITLIGGNLSYGKTSISDSTNAGYYISSAGFYFGSATDASYVKYLIGTTAFDIKATLNTGVGSVINGTYIDSLNVGKLTAGTITSQIINLASSSGWSSPVLIDSYSETNQDDLLWMDTPSGSDLVAGGNSFACSVTGYYLSSAKFYIKSLNPVAGDYIYAKLYAHSGTYGTDSIPTGTALAVSTGVLATSIPGSLTLITFTFDKTYLLVNGTKYCIVFSILGIHDTSDFALGIDVSSPSHGGNYFRSAIGGGEGGWVYHAGVDTCFYVYGESQGYNQCYIASGKTDFTNTESGFILGIDDDNVAKLYIGNAINYLNWDGTSLLINGNLVIKSTTGTLTGEPIVAGNPVCLGQTADEPVYGEGTITKDAYVWQRNPTTNYGTATVVKIGFEGSGSDWYQMKGYIWFDILKPYNINSSVKLRLYQDNVVGDTSINIYRVTQTWIESGDGSITWNAQPTNDGVVWGSGVLTGSGQYLEIDITNLYWCWKLDVHPNYGIMISGGSAGSNNYVQLKSKEFGEGVYTPHWSVIGIKDASKVYRAGVTNDYQCHNYIGIAAESVDTDDTPISIQTFGINPNQASLIAGSDYFIDSIYGITSVAPSGNVLKIGKALSTTTLLMAQPTHSFYSEFFITSTSPAYYFVPIPFPPQRIFFHAYYTAAATDYSEGEATAVGHESCHRSNGSTSSVCASTADGLILFISKWTNCGVLLAVTAPAHDHTIRFSATG